MDDLGTFVEQWEGDYQSRLKQVSLLDPSEASTLSLEQREYFAHLFWHVRGHFAEFLWILGSKAPDKKSKQVVLDNIADEFGARSDEHTSHEVLYNRFAESLGADTTMTPVDDAYYPTFLREYNQDHLRFMLGNDWNTCSALFSGYESLDNSDYGAVEEIGKAWGLDRHSLEFFEVHRKSDHFGEVSSELDRIWKEDQSAVTNGFTFIGKHQLAMWQELSTTIFGYEG
jgi:hypothetical protein